MKKSHRLGLFGLATLVFGLLAALLGHLAARALAQVLEESDLLEDLESDLDSE